MSTTPPTPPSGGAGDAGAPLLAVFAHPDDETLQAGALLALEAARGRRVVVVTATRGERGEMIGMHETEGTAEVAEIRMRERRDALAALGVHESHVLDELAGDGVRWTDSGMRWVAPGVAGPAADAPPTALTSGDLDGQAAALAGLVRRLRPGLVVCDEPGGAYGHPDHVRTHAITMAAVDLAARGDGAAATADGGDGPWVVPAVGWVAQEADRLVAARAEVARGIAFEGAVGEDGEALTVETGELPSIARSAADVDVTLDATRVVPNLLAAMRCYDSQVQGATVPAIDRALLAGRGVRALRTDQAAVGWFALSNGVAQPILPVVSLELAHGDAAAAGLTASVVVDDARREDGAGPADGASTSPLAPREDAPAAGGRAERTWVRVLTGVLLGLVAATAGTLLHRARLGHVPYGMVLACAIVLVAAMLARSIGRGPGVVGSILGVLAGIQALTYLGRGGDVLVAQDGFGLTWLGLSLAAAVAAAFVPDRWVGERTGSRGSG
ncbi:MAG: hypothetical protein BGO96_04130 [Micrococcales bacterium 73-15]|uniref:PIG-L family deacetylase n=1 Tax=Salana multivorans TaxID=120377 RepID=UPI000959CCB8|nr:PIG-L family deacetylase [Salana multivorans]OJX98369.1 MAG: hypothetical protein BGO96_04130 [Micrococcales bacterium 73-15]